MEMTNLKSHVFDLYQQLAWGKQQLEREKQQNSANHQINNNQQKSREKYLEDKVQ